MTGKELIKAILDSNMIDEEIVILGTDENGAIDDESSYSIEEVNKIEMDSGDIACAIVINASVSE